jgi:hypothetical protein
MYPRTLVLVLCAFGLFANASFSAKMTEWKDIQGNAFTAEPLQIAGPIAVFRSEKRWAKLVPFQFLSPEDCVRFYNSVKDKPPLAAEWSNATHGLTRDVYRYSQQLRVDKLVASWLQGRREPEFIIVVFGSNGIAESWQSIDKILPLYTFLKQSFGDRVEALFYGIDHTPSDHSNMAVRKSMPWLVADFGQQRELNEIRQFAPSSKAGVMVLSHEGVPFFAADIGDMDKITQPLIELTALLEAMRPENPKSWKGREHYLRAVQPVIHANSTSQPICVGNPLQAEGLRQRKVFLVDATLDIDANGKVTRVDVKPDEANLPSAMMAPIASALQRSSIFVPAVDHGKFVAAPYHYRLEVPR